MGACRVLFLFILVALPSLAQGQQFASVIIKPSQSSAFSASRLQILPDGSLTGHSISVIELIGLAYSVPENPSPRLAALPDWAVGRRFDIEAKSSVPLGLDAQDIPTQRRSIERLLQMLLKDSFGLVISVKTVKTPVYALTLSGSRQKLTGSALSSRDCILDIGADGCHSFAIGFGHPLNSKGVDMSDLALYLENWTDLPVVDHTATSALFAMHSEGWQPMNLPPPPPGASGTGAEFARLSTLAAVLGNLGLQVHRQQETLPFYTVERLNQPTPK